MDSPTQISIERTESTPYMFFDPQTGVVNIRGVSIPEDTEDFYGALLKSLQAYSEQPEGGSLEVKFQFIYINTGTSAMIVRLLKILNDLPGDKFKVDIKWFYEEGDEDMRDLGIYFNSFTGQPFEILPSSENF
ncbi:MAG TPA: hypothetical protein DCM08_07890 [Microscillaceae bacterium]|jgi:hypothetical protein|nr:hypothetical protein [Microscillaceae bacterium]